MTKLTKKTIDANIEALTNDPLVRTMAIETLKGQAEGIPMNLNTDKFNVASHETYLNRGGTIEPIIVGAVAVAIIKVRQQLEEITAQQVKVDSNDLT